MYSRRVSVDSKDGIMARQRHGGTDNREKLSVFPAFHKVSGRTVLVVGHGDEAAAKVRLVAETSADIVVIAPEVEASLVAAIERAGARRLARSFRPADLQGAALVFAATGDEATDKAVVEAAHIFGIPANAVDRPELCDFYTPALVNRAPLAVAISTAGAGPVLARHVRARIEALLPERLGTLAHLADTFRGAVARLIDGASERRAFWAKFFSGPVADHALAGDSERARAEANRLLNAPSKQSGFVWLVGAGPGAADLLTLRAQRVLQEADVIVHDGLVPDVVVAMGRRDAERIPVGKAKGAHSVSQAQINEILVEHARRGLRVVRLKAGDPMVFGRAGEEIAALEDADIAFDVVPGVTAAIAAASSARIPLTLRGVSSSIVFATGHDMNGDTLPDWAGLALSGTTIAVYMGKSVAGTVADRLIGAGLDSSTPVLAIENASRADERVFGGMLADLWHLSANPDLSGPVLIVIGDVAGHAALSSALPLNAADAVAA